MPAPTPLSEKTAAPTALQDTDLVMISRETSPGSGVWQTFKMTGAQLGSGGSGGPGGWDAKLEPAISSGVLDIDLTNPAGFIVTLDQDVTTLSFSNVPSDKVVVFTIVFVQDATGGRAVTWPAEVQGTPSSPSVAASSITVMSFVTWDGGSTIYQAPVA